MINVTWFDKGEESILILFDSSWTWDEFHNVLSQVNELLDSTPKKVDLIFDFTNGYIMPGGAIPHLRRMITSGRPNRKRIILIGVKNFSRSFEFLLKLTHSSPSSLVIVNTITEALEIITSVDNSPYNVSV